MIEITVGICESFGEIGINISERDLRTFEAALHHRGLNVVATAPSTSTSAWLPIEIAPKDGSRCDVWSVYTDAYEARGQRYVDAQYREHEAAWFDKYGNKLDWSELDESDDMKPRGRRTTHWMPIPAGPHPRNHGNTGGPQS